MLPQHFMENQISYAMFRYNKNKIQLGQNYGIEEPYWGLSQSKG